MKDVIEIIGGFLCGPTLYCDECLVYSLDEGSGGSDYVYGSLSLAWSSVVAWFCG